MNDDHVARTREAYGTSADRFAATVGTSISSAFEAPIDRALLGAFVELARRPTGLVLDAGCGPGRVARLIADHGLDVLGIDVAPGMIDAARAAHADLRFEVAELTKFPVESSSLAGVAYWYSIITTAPDDLFPIWSELDRTLSADGVALVAFQCGAGEPVEKSNAFGTDTDLTLFRHDVERVCTGIEDASLRVHAVTRRSPTFAHESSDQAFVFVTRSTEAAALSTSIESSLPTAP